MGKRLSDGEIVEALRTLPGWGAGAPGFIRRDWALGDFDRAMELINRVADIARALDHHPNLSNVYDRVTIELQTHDVGGITAKDVEFARQVNALGID